MIKKQGRIHGNPVADDWAGAVMQKSLGIQKCDQLTDRPTDRRTDQGVESCVRNYKNHPLKTRDVEAEKFMPISAFHHFRFRFYRVFHIK